MNRRKQHILTINGGSSSIKFALFETTGSLSAFWRAGLSESGLAGGC